MVEKKIDSPLCGMTRVAYNVPESEARRILRNYKYKVSGPRSSLQYQTRSGKTTLYINSMDAIYLGLSEK
jgi:hypothetical protein